MSTKIFYNDNRIIIDGHAGTAEECQAITAMCDEMANSENFKTIVYEQGHAVFERVGGGERAMFLAGLITEERVAEMIERRLESLYTELRGTYLTQTDAADIYATKVLFNNGIDELKSVIGSIDPSTQGSVKQLLGTLNTTVENLSWEVEHMSENVGADIKALKERFGKVDALAGRIEGLENKASKTLPYTADELIAKLESINL